MCKQQHARNAANALWGSHLCLQEHSAYPFPIASRSKTRAGLLLPSLFVHAEHEQPENHQCCPEEAEGGNEREHTVSQRWIKEAEPTEASNHRQHSQEPGQKGGLENEVTLQQRRESEKCQCHSGAVVIHVQKEERQSL